MLLKSLEMRQRHASYSNDVSLTAPSPAPLSAPTAPSSTSTRTSSSFRSRTRVAQARLERLGQRESHRDCRFGPRLVDEVLVLSAKALASVWSESRGRHTSSSGVTSSCTTLLPVTTSILTFPLPSPLAESAGEAKGSRGSPPGKASRIASARERQRGMAAPRA